MRMDQTKELDAKYIVNNYKEEDIANILFRYGEERFARNIAKKIIEVRKNKEINTTFELVDIIKSAYPKKELNKKGHPAKQTFQALRIAVNDELRVFEDSLYQAFDLLNKDGYIVVITFHSLEDRLCKVIFKEKSTVDIPKGVPMANIEEAPFELITKHPIVPSDEELEYNNRAHSAKMRVIRKR